MFNPEKVKLGIAPIAWTNDDMPELGGENTFEQCVSEMALAGFEGCEIGTKYPADPKVLKRALDLRGLQICNRWFSSFLISKPFADTEKDFRAELAFLKELGAKVIGASEQSGSIQGLPVPVLGEKKPVMDDKQWDIFCSGLNKLGEIAKSEGMRLTFHHHMGTVVQTAEEIDRMMANTDPDLVYLLFDSGHLAYCGEDYLAVLRQYVSRVGHVHLKDIRPDVVARVRAEDMSFLDGVRAGAFTVPGDGCVDFDGIFRILSENNYEGWMLVEAEQDPAKANPLEYAILARKFIRERAGL
ncbi:MAG: myo-inosose-2 dehydratase [Oscillospiraceae bacterium]|nr:myo-inosose-2 dehydratase [Oscillospiraceae bacterium]